MFGFNLKNNRVSYDYSIVRLIPFLEMASNLLNFYFLLFLIYL